jgi:hypothetical protein
VARRRRGRAARRSRPASGLVATARQVGGSLGPAILATIASDRPSRLGGAPAAEAMTSGFHAAFVVAAVAAAAGGPHGVTPVRQRRPTQVAPPDHCLK